MNDVIVLVMTGVFFTWLIYLSARDYLDTRRKEKPDTTYIEMSEFEQKYWSRWPKERKDVDGS